MVLYDLREVFKNQFLLNYLQKHTKKRKGMAFTIYVFLFTFTNMKLKIKIPISCPNHLSLHLHILPHQNIRHHFQ